MADPKLQRQIGVKIANATAGEYVKITNLTNGGQYYAKLAGSPPQAIISQNDDFTWANGDIIQAEIHGRINGYQRDTIRAGGISEMTIDDASADTTTPGADL